MSGAAPDRGSRDEDAAWADLVRRLQAPDGPAADTTDADAAGTGADTGLSGPAGTGTAAPGPRAGDPDPSAPGRPAPARPPRDPRTATPGATAGPRDYALDEDEDDGEFIPEDPPPLGTGDPLAVVCWSGAVGAPLALLLAALFWRDAPAMVWLGLCAVFLAAVGTLLWRLPRHRRDDYDDGSRV
ncbi:hypothetical protein ACQ3I4_03370 [Zafaria sp. Z1313]|uniref:hypothetical protein n=1 Tax=unclassified Zafaria TaxID=2828765 RepID=UPI002E79A8DB|nr:hypothetical protein [Zafaria sp. J156]MEE1622159.1 hypothetical protein [Zafaria sp. J156]